MFKSTWKYLTPLVALVVISLILMAPGAPKQNQSTGRAPQGANIPDKEPPPNGEVTVGELVEPSTTIAFRDLPEIEAEPLLDREINPRLNVSGSLPPDFNVEGGPDPLLAKQSAATEYTSRTFSEPDLNIDGQGYTNVNPPDTVGDVGLNYYVQMINGGGGTGVGIYNKDGTLAVPIRYLDQMGSGACASGLGDPIVLYDQHAQRWLLSEFASSGNYLCVYISQTNDPSGSYYAYAFNTPNFPDYPKYAVWPGSYIVTTNESSPRVHALDRVGMLAGLPVTMQTFSVSSLSGFGFQALTPADPDGSTAPPAGADPILMRHRDDEVHNAPGTAGTDYLDMFSVHVDWDTPSNSAITTLPVIPIAEIDSTLCGLTSYECFPQPGTGVVLDPLREVIMWRLQYRNFGSYETLVGNLVTDVNGSNQGGIRWFELRRTYPGVWSLYQEGTYSPDSDNRWMGAIAMDGQGNIALGYNASSSTTYPSLRYTGRQNGDSLGVMTQSEATLIAGSGSNGSNRYGDYSAMNIDPADDCTFWFTGEYNASGQWSTRIGAFRFDSCGDARTFSLSVTPMAQKICAPDNANFEVEVTGYNGWDSPITLETENLPSGVNSSFSTNPVNPVSGPVTSDLTIGNTQSAPAGTYILQVNGVASTYTSNTNVSLEIYSGTAGDVQLSSPVDEAVNQSLQPSFAWESNSLAESYQFQIASSPDFVPTGIVESAADLTTEDYDLLTTLDNGTCYWWRVNPENVCGVNESETVFAFFTNDPAGEVTVFSDDMESGDGKWQHSADAGSDSWELTNGAGHNSTYAWTVPDAGEITDSYLYTKDPLPVTTGTLLSFWHHYQFESSFDGAVLEISTDSGISWTDLGSDIMQNGYNGILSNSYGNPLGGQSAWVDDQTAWIQVVVDLSAYDGQDAQFRWRFGADDSVSDIGWFIDDVEVITSNGSMETISITNVVPEEGSPFEPTQVTINGENFTDDVYVRVNDTWLSDVTVISPTEIQVVVSAGVMSGRYRLTVYNTNCQTDWVEGGSYLVFVPVIRK